LIDISLFTASFIYPTSPDPSKGGAKEWVEEYC